MIKEVIAAELRVARPRLIHYLEDAGDDSPHQLTFERLQSQPLLINVTHLSPFTCSHGVVTQGHWAYREQRQLEDYFFPTNHNPHISHIDEI